MAGYGEIARGSGILLLKENNVGALGWNRIGNLADFTTTIEAAKDPFFSSEASTRFQIGSDTPEMKAMGEGTLYEQTAVNKDMLLQGDGIQAGSQAASTLEGVSVTVAEGLYTEIGYKNLTYLKIMTQTSETFEADETITSDGTGTPSATVIFADNANKTLYCVGATAAFTTGTITGGTSAASAVISSVETKTGAIVTDAAVSPTALYTIGSDFSIIPEDGMIQKNIGSTIPGTEVFISADYPALTIEAIRALTDPNRTYEMKFIATNSQGPKWNLHAWDVSIIAGAIPRITADRVGIPYTMDFNADLENHPDEPYFREELVRAA